MSTFSITIDPAFHLLDVIWMDVFTSNSGHTKSYRNKVPAGLEDGEYDLVRASTCFPVEQELTILCPKGLALPELLNDMWLFERNRATRQVTFHEGMAEKFPASEGWADIN